MVKPQKSVHDQKSDLLDLLDCSIFGTNDNDVLDTIVGGINDGRYNFSSNLRDLYNDQQYLCKLFPQ